MEIEKISTHGEVALIKKVVVGVLIMAFVSFIFIVLYNINNASTEFIMDDAFIECFSKKAILYTTSVCPYCIKQKKLFGDYLSKINYTDCDLNMCNGIEIVPTWIIEGNEYLGFQTLEQLKEISMC